MSIVSPGVGKASTLRLNSVESGTPFFCLCGVLIYKSFAERLSDNPVYGMYAEAEVTSLTKEERKINNLLSFEALTESYVEGVKQSTTGKNIILSGLSFGGMVALEVAKKLTEQGYKIEHIVLLDTFIPTSNKRSIRKLAKDIKANVFSMGLGDTAKDLGRRFKKKLEAMKHGPIATNAMKMKRPTQFSQLANTFTGSEGPYDFDVLLVKASDSNMGFGMVSDHDYGLSQIITGEIEVASVKAVHTGMVQKGAVDDTCKAVQDYMDRSAQSS